MNNILLNGEFTVIEADSLSYDDILTLSEKGGNLWRVFASTRTGHIRELKDGDRCDIRKGLIIRIVSHLEES